MKLAEAYARLFSSPDGELVLADLKAQFYELPLLATDNPQITTVRAAQRDVVQYTLDMMEGKDG